jgi:hypothetical protein
MSGANEGLFLLNHTNRIIKGNPATPTSPSKVMLLHYDGGFFEGCVGQNLTNEKSFLRKSEGFIYMLHSIFILILTFNLFFES